MKQKLLIPIISTLLITGCGSSSFNSGNSEFDAPVSINITDAPIDNATAVNITVNGIGVIETVTDSEGQQRNQFAAFVRFSEAKMIDLLSLQGTASENLLTDIDIPIGNYKELRLFLNSEDNANTISLENGGTELLQIGNAAQFGLRLFSDFSITQGGNDLTVDVDLRQSITLDENNQYNLNAAGRIVDNATVGSLTGNIESTSCGINNTEQEAAVYLYQGKDVTPFDYGTEQRPLTSVLLNAQTGMGITYEAGFLPQGSYTVALVCDAVNDTVNQDDELTVTATANIEIVSGEITTQDLPASDNNDDGDSGDDNGPISLPFLP